MTKGQLLLPFYCIYLPKMRRISSLSFRFSTQFSTYPQSVQTYRMIGIFPIRVTVDV